MADRFVWYEYMSADPAGAASFYGEVVGWRVSDWEGSSDYSILETETGAVGGLMKMPAEACETGSKPGWLGYVGVADADAAAACIAGAGGAVHKGPWDVPGVGRLAAVSDPQGAVFMLSQQAGPEAAPPPMQPGHVGWHELYTSDWEAAFGFYESQFGWTKDETLEMDPMGTYQLFAAGGDAIGGMMNDPAGEPPRWLFYFVIDDIDAAMARTKQAGGSIFHGPMEVPGGAWVAHGRDPEHALFAMVGGRSKQGETA